MHGKLLATAVLLFLPLAAASVFDVKQYGAKGDGVAKDTAAIQSAIDAAAQAGGGTVALPAGTYLSGTLHLRSHIRLEVGAGAVLKMSPDKEDFDPYEKLPYNTHSDAETSYFHHALLAAEDAEHITIAGPGIIDGNRTRRRGPKPIAVKNCRHLTVRDITIMNAPNYAVSFIGCEWVVIDGITVRNAYADGIDPDCSRNVRISNCFIDSSDDSIVPKSSFALGESRITENITVTNCVTTTSANHFKLGTESGGAFRNIAVSNMTMFTRRKPQRPDEAGIAIDIVDGGAVKGLTISNVSMHDVQFPFFIRLGTRKTGPKPYSYGTIENVSIANVVAVGSYGTATISGLPDHLVGSMTFENVSITMRGGVRKPVALDLPEKPTDYAWPYIWGERPAWAFWARHAAGLTLRNFQCRWQDADLRPALAFDDVTDLELDGFKAATAEQTAPIIRLNDVRGAVIKGSRTLSKVGRLVLATGPATRDVKLMGNDLTSVAVPVEAGPEVPKPAWRGIGNLER